MAPRLGVGDGDDDFVPLARADLVVTARAAVGLPGLVRLHVADLDRVGRVGVLVGPPVGHGSAAEDGPGHEYRDHHERNRDHDGVGAPRDSAPERVQSHGPTVFAAPVTAATRAPATR